MVWGQVDAEHGYDEDETGDVVMKHVVYQALGQLRFFDAEVPLSPQGEKKKDSCVDRTDPYMKFSYQILPASGKGRGEN